MSGRIPSGLVISLDFELGWGIRGLGQQGSTYTENLLGARSVIPRMLKLFEEFEVGATWATVGFLFARSRDELMRFRPAVLPRYDDARLSPYDDPVGADERSDPLHYAPSLIERIVATPRQEIATHTFSHYFCREAGQTADAFRADLEAARDIMGTWGLNARSIVFPRNQHNPAYDGVLSQAGIVAYRGNPTSWMWRFANAKESALGTKRAARLVDSYLPLTRSGIVDWAEVPQSTSLADVRASFFVRPHNPRLRYLEGQRVRRLRGAVRAAALAGGMVHLWWHPHNFGAHPDESLALLRRVLEEFERCRARFDMQSFTMAQAAEAVGVAAPAPMSDSATGLHHA